MFDAPVDTWYLWLGVATASLLVLGVAMSLPASAPPNAARAAATVDAVAASPHNATGEHPLGAEEIDLGSSRLALRDAGGTDHAQFAAPVTPVRPGTDLAAVLEGTPPGRVFEHPRAFRAAAGRARNGSHGWRSAGDRLVVRRVVWGGVDVTLAGT